MRFILLALFVCAVGCKHASSSSSTTHTETSTVTDTTSSETGSTTTTTVVQTEPGETVTTINEYDPPEKEAAPEEVAPEQDRSPGVADPGQSSAPKLPRRGPLRKQTVIEDKHGATTAKTAQEAISQGTAASETRAAGKEDVQAKAADSRGPSVGCIGASWLWGAAVLVGVVGIVYFAIKMRKTV